ncbi:MAG: carbamoyltransferase C-terminal domain-containing protein [archaeon]
MIVLGITDGHDAGAAIIKNGKIIAAINEERIVRKKLYTGLPKESIKSVLKLTKIEHGQIDKVAIAATSGMVASLGWTDVSSRKKVYQQVAKRFPAVAGSQKFAKMQRQVFTALRPKDTETYVRSLGIDAPVVYVDHHLCHAACAYYTGGKKNALVITSDGSGDGLSSTVYVGKDGVLKKIKSVPTLNSVAYYYAYITLIAGFKMFKHEGKITGLAAYGNPDKCYDVFKNCFGYSTKTNSPYNQLGMIGEDAIKHLRKELKPYSKEDYSAAIQKRSEDVTTKFVEEYVKKTGLGDVMLAGGLFANVKINQRIAEAKGVKSVYIHPHMGDGGLGAGAALYVAGRAMAHKGKGLMPYKLDNVYFGTGFTNSEIEQAITDKNMKGEYIKNIEKYIGEMLTKKKIIGHFDGKMEFGPRALGNRSILADPQDKTINKWLNERLHRTEFMPFAPSILDTAAPKYYENYARSKYAAQFMTITFDDTKIAQKAKAVVHVDNTTRPQVVSKNQNPRYYKILQQYQRESGLPIFVNTSFNSHEEPIIHTPENGLNSFNKGTVDILVMGNWVVTKRK